MLDLHRKRQSEKRILEWTVVSNVGVVVDDSRLVGAADVDGREAVADGRGVVGRNFGNVRSWRDCLKQVKHFFKFLVCLILLTIFPFFL